MDRFARLGTCAPQAVCLTEEVFEIEVAAMRDCGRMRLKTTFCARRLGGGGEQTSLNFYSRVSRQNLSNIFTTTDTTHFYVLIFICNDLIKTVYNI
jgi:hypothetical protein